MDTVLIVDEDAQVQAMLTKVVRSIGLAAECTKSAEKALKLLSEHIFTLILMDVNLSGADGFATVEAIRRQGIKTPLVIVSERQSDFDIVYGLDIGADDYIAKSFNPVTLGAKLKALIRRSRCGHVGADQMMTAGPFAYNASTLRLYKQGVEISLSSKENAMMKLFIDNVNRVFTKEMLYDLVWGEAVIDENAVMVYINRLRQKIEDEPSKPRFIQNVRGIGYRFVV
ncbi:MAG: response regulator transcription factor [Clostridiales bacterium]|nr:response regulator transcription factor [Clostridiales bacterium]